MIFSNKYYYKKEYERAKNEIDILKKKNGNNKAYDNALKMFEGVIKKTDDDTSNLTSFDILKKLLDEEVLTPLEDSDFNIDRGNIFGDEHIYATSRTPRVFKAVSKDGNIRYADHQYIRRVNNLGCSRYTIYCDYISDYIPKITMPYTPVERPYTVLQEEFYLGEDGTVNASLKKSGYSLWPFNSAYVTRIITPEGKEIKVNKLYVFKDGDIVETECSKSFRAKIRRAVKKASYKVEEDEQ